MITHLGDDFDSASSGDDNSEAELVYLDGALHISPENLDSDQLETVLPYLLDSPTLDTNKGPRQPAHPMLSRQKPEQITILKGSQSAYPLLQKKSTGELFAPPIMLQEHDCPRRSRPNRPEPRRSSSQLRSPADQTLSNGYTFPTSIAQSIPRGPMRPLCAVPPAGYTSEAITPLLGFFKDEDDDEENDDGPDPRFRDIASPASDFSMNGSSDSHGIIMITDRPFSPTSVSPDLRSSESSLPTTPEASDVGHGHLLQIYGDEQPTLEQLIAEQLPITLRRVEFDDNGSVYVVDLSKAARKAAKRAEKEAEKEAKKEAKAVRKASRRFSIANLRAGRDVSPVSPVSAESTQSNESALRRAAEAAEKLEAEQMNTEKSAQDLSRHEARREARGAEGAEARRLLPLKADEDARIDREEAIRERLETEQRLMRRAALKAEQMERERAERAAFEQRRAEERAARESAFKVEAERQVAPKAKERCAVQDKAEMGKEERETTKLREATQIEDAKSRAKIARRHTTRTMIPPPSHFDDDVDPLGPAPNPSKLIVAAASRLSARSPPDVDRLPTQSPKTPAQLEKEAYQISKARSEMEARIQDSLQVQQDILDHSRVSTNLNTMANDLVAARTARRNSKILDYGYPSAVFDPPLRTKGVGLRLITTSPTLDAGTAHPRSKSKSKVVAMVSSVAPALSPSPRSERFPKGFRSISYDDLEDAAEDKEEEEDVKAWRAAVQMNTLHEERRRNQDFREWLRRRQSEEVTSKSPNGSAEFRHALDVLPRRHSEDPGISSGHGAKKNWDGEESETVRTASDPDTRPMLARHQQHLSNDSDEWEDTSNGSALTPSDQEVNFHTSDLDKPVHRKIDPKSPELAVLTQPLRRASTVRLIKLERSGSVVHQLPEPTRPSELQRGQTQVKSRVASQATSVG